MTGHPDRGASMDGFDISTVSSVIYSLQTTVMAAYAFSGRAGSKSNVDRRSSSID